MPFLIRIILQRILLFIYSILAFLGIAPEINIHSAQDSVVAEENRKSIILSILSEKESDSKIDQLEKRSSKNEDSKPLEKIITENPKYPETPIKTNAPPTKTIEPQISPKMIDESKILPTTIVNPAVILDSLKPNTGSIGQKPVSAEDVLVNTVCAERDGRSINVTTGSGVVISPQGVVITNAHVAQFFLLQDYNRSVSCAIYRENLPAFGFEAKILYISKEWINKNYDLIRTKEPKGTGEHDYALLYITKHTNSSIKLPTSFPSARIDQLKDPVIGSKVLVGGYPGGHKNIIDITKSLNLKTEVVDVLDIFTFGNNRPDVFTVSRSKVGAKGSSGGGVFESGNNGLELLGIIVTTDDTGGNARINAITTNYINRAIKSETGNDLKYYLSGNLKDKSEKFKGVHLDDLASLLVRK